MANDASFLLILSAILKAAIPGDSAGDTFGDVYFRGSTNPFWLPCYVRRVNGNATLIRQIMSAYAANGQLAQDLSRNSLFNVTYAGEVQYNIGMSEPPTRLPTLTPGGGGGSVGSTAPSQAPASSRVDFFLVSCAIELDTDIP